MTTRVTGQEIAERRIGQRAGIFVRPLLIVVGYADLHAGGKEQSRFGFGLYRPAAVCTPFIGGATANCQHFGTVEDILVGVRQSCCHTPVAGTECTFRLRRHGVHTSA